MNNFPIKYFDILSIFRIDTPNSFVCLEMHGDVNLRACHVCKVHVQRSDHKYRVQHKE